MDEFCTATEAEEIVVYYYQDCYGDCEGECTLGENQINFGSEPTECDCLPPV